MPTTTLPEPARAALDAPNFATVATLEPDGQPQLSLVWVKRDGDELVFSTTRGRRKERNITRDPRVSVLLYPTAAPYSYLEVRGNASITEEGGRELIDELARKYTDHESYPWDSPDTVRVVVRVTPDKVVWHG